MTAPVKLEYGLHWMNKSKYKDEKGKLIIKHYPKFTDEKKVRDEFERVTKIGYAAKITVSECHLMDVINFSNEHKLEQRYVALKNNDLVANDRWKLRMKEKEIRVLTQQKENAEKHLKEITEKLKKLQEE